MKKTLSMFCFFLVFNALVVYIVSSETTLLSKNLKTEKKKQDDGIDGIGTSVNPKGKKEVKKDNTPIVITAPPFKVVECNQILMFNAEYINDMKDFRKRKPAFFTINVLSAYIFESKDANKLIHSSNFTQTSRLTGPLKGARGCIAIDGGKVNADITICFKDEKHAGNLLDAIESFAKCRMGDNLVPIPADQIKKLARACGKVTEKEKPFEMKLDIRAGNKWDEDRAKFFQPNKIKVPGTPDIPDPKDEKKE